MGVGVCYYRTMHFPHSPMYVLYRMRGKNGRATKITINIDVSQSFPKLVAT